MNNYDWLLSRLDVFIRKYYANRVIRGSLIFLSAFLFYILSISIGEYYLYMPAWLRITIVSLLVICGVSALIVWVVIPLFKMGRLGKQISHEQAANIIGKHFPEISDKLLNILQLKKHPDSNASRELIDASITQKINQISIVPITAAIDFSKNRKYLRFLLPLLLIGVFILVAAPNVFRDASTRLLQPTKTFEKPSPFEFIIQNKSLKAVRNSDFILTVTTEGKALPAEGYIEIGDERIPMQPGENHTFQYTFKNLTESVDFKFFAAGFYSSSNILQVVQKPTLKTFRVEVNYPSYTGKKDEIRNSLGDMTVPVGTKIGWTFVTEHTDNATIHFGSGAYSNLSKNAATFMYQYRFMNDTDYTFTFYNNPAGVADSFRYHVQIIPDQYPVIQLQQHEDSVTKKQILLTGTAGDDYGITRVTFNYEISSENGQKEPTKIIPLKITPGALTTFQNYFDIDDLNLQPGQRLSYYIEAWDNDGVHGSKASRSEVMTYQMYDKKQIDSAINENSQQINSGLSNGSEKTQQLQTEYKEMQTKMLESDNIDWSQQQSLKEMMKKQQDLQTQVENVKKRFDEQVKQSEQKQYSDDLKDKQKELEKQLDNLLNDELKAEMKKLEDLMQKLNKQDEMKAMQEMAQENKLFKMDMERMQDLMKQLEMQMRMEDLASKADELAQKQKDLENKTLDPKNDNKALGKEQGELKKQLDKMMNEDMKDAKKLGKETKQEDLTQDAEKSGQNAQQDMQQGEQQLGQGQKSGAGKSQSKAAKNLQDMAESLRAKAGGMSMEQIDIDIQATRLILSNLIRLSFDQEDLMQSVKVTSAASEQYITNQEEQNKLHGNSQMIRDSLFVLSKRIFKLAPDINLETTQLEYNMKKAVDALEDRSKEAASTDQQYVMTHTNNLALMLNNLLASLMQMKMEGAAQMPSNGSCNKPGGKGKGSKPGPGDQLSDIITQQQQLGDAMQQMQQSMQRRQGKQPGPGEGKKPGQGNGGGSGNQGKQGNNNNENGDPEQLALLAEQQAFIRQKLQELNNELNSSGMAGNAKELQELQAKMDKNETDLVNRRLDNELLLRQKDIQTRLLESEKSLREQDQDNKRESRTGQEVSRPVPPELQKYITDRQQLLELYKTVPPQLKPYYKDIVEHYFQLIGNK